MANFVRRNNLLLATRHGKAIRFAVDAVRVFRGRDSTGVRGMKLLGDDEVVSMSIIAEEEPLYPGMHPFGVAASLVDSKTSQTSAINDSQRLRNRSLSSDAPLLE